ncbi:MAG: hypothetical protein ACK52J_02310 [bacterium]
MENIEKLVNLRHINLNYNFISKIENLKTFKILEEL